MISLLLSQPLVNQNWPLPLAVYQIFYYPRYLKPQSEVCSVYLQFECAETVNNSHSQRTYCVIPYSN